ncbi:MAG TPA: hypothetical protein DDW52_10970 [Planctomycetaceae bacterium]|nr:hypothetical protein [Planctomycetaceae bacterium]
MSRSQFSALEELSHDMERVFDSLLGRTVGSVLRGADQKISPPVDVVDFEDKYVVVADLPGVDAEAVSVEVHENNLLLGGQRNEKDSTGESLRSERPTGQFRRQIPLPGEFNVDAIEADYSNGVLTVTLPKLSPKQPTKIKVVKS